MGAGQLMANLTKGKIVPDDLVEKAIFKQFHQVFAAYPWSTLGVPSEYPRSTLGVPLEYPGGPVTAALGVPLECAWSTVLALVQYAWSALRCLLTRR